MTIEPFDAVLAEMLELAAPSRYPLIGNGNVRRFADRLADAHAAGVAEREAARALDHAAMNALLARAEAAERDARRYRVLRSRAPDALNCLVSEWDFFGDAAEQLDAHFDAAIATTEQADED